LHMSIQKQTSETASGTLFLRALACYEPDERIRGEDCLAKLFLPEERRAALESETGRAKAMEKIDRRMYHYIIARTKYFDRLLEDGLKNKIPQVVILGAGYDSRAYRYRNLIGGAGVFEVDAPYTQGTKVGVLSRNDIGYDHVRFVPVDFEKDDLAEALLKSGFDGNRPALFLWEGVTLYLTQDAIISTLAHIASVSGGGCVLAFDYLNFQPDSKIRKRDELIQYGMEKDEMAAAVCRCGFSVVENLDPVEIEKKFLARGDGQLFGETKRTMNFIKAKRKGRLEVS